MRRAGHKPGQTKHRKKEKAMTSLTLKSMNDSLNPMGVKVTRRDGEYRVAFRDCLNAEDSAYYTNDASDALDTGMSMANARGSFRPRG